MPDLPWLLVVGVAVLVAGATAVRSVGRIWLRHWAERRLAGDDAAAGDLDRPYRMLVTATAAIAALTAALGVHLGERTRPGVGLGLTFVEWSVALLVLGQLVPRAAGRRWAGPVATVMLPVLRALEVLARPAMAAVWRAARPRADAMASPADEDVLGDLLREGEAEGVGGADESKIIAGVAEFGAKRAGDVMTPREQVVAVERTLPPEAAARLVAQAQFSRVPVIEGSLDQVVGMVHSFDVLARPWAPLAQPRPVVWATLDTPCLELMQRMLRARSHLAIIRDATGRTAGLATLEDLMEELVGDIRDEHDEPGSAAEAGT